jgi:hypothetical protein
MNRNKDIKDKSVEVISLITFALLKLFEPVALRGRPCYSNLSCHSFSTTEKEYFLETIIHVMNENGNYSCASLKSNWTWKDWFLMLAIRGCGG